MFHKILMTMALVLALALALGCSSNDPAPPAFSSAVVDNPTVTAAGGTVTVDAPGALLDGTSVVFPAGTVADGTTVDIATGPGQTINDTAAEQVSPTVRVQARNAAGELLTNFSAPLTIRIPYDPALVTDTMEVGVFSAKDNGTEPTIIDIHQEVSPNFFEFATDHLSIFFLMRRKIGATVFTSVSSMAPSSGPTAGGTAFVIYGKGFVNPISVTIGGATVSDAIALTSSQITGTTPAGSLGEKTVEVFSAIDDGASKTTSFTFTAPTGGGSGGGTWTPTGSNQPPARTSFSTANAGDAYVFGGLAGSTELNDLWRINSNFAQSNQLEGVQLSSTNAPSARELAMMEAYYQVTGKIFVWGGRAGGVALGDGGIYDLATDTWSAIASANAPSPRWGAAVWLNETTKKFYIWGGTSESGKLGDGAVYDTATDAWTPISSVDAPSARDGMAFVTDPNNAIGYLFGGYSTGDQNDLYSYDFTLDQWTLLSPTGTAPSPRYGAAFGYNYNAGFAVWGGESSVASVLGDGAVYEPTTNAWVTMPTADAPSARQEMAFVRGGSGLFIFGGYDASANALGNGFMFEWSTQTWVAAPATDSPSARGGAKAIYWGQFFVWGGADAGVAKNDGGVWEPPHP